MMHPYDAAGVLDRLYDFQRATVEHAFRRLYLDADSTRRFLVADETGLGKTHVAQGVIAKAIEHLQHLKDLNRIDIVYVCSNADIAAQNLRKLVVTGEHHAAPATRLTLLVAEHELLRPSTQEAMKPVTFVAFTPATSFEFGWQTGKAEERAVLFELLTEHLDLGRADRTGLKRILQGTVGSLSRFQDYVDRLKARTDGRWEPGIRHAFLRSVDQAETRGALEALLNDVRGRGALTAGQKDRTRRLTAELRRLLARAGVNALEPDLVILDEFQRFRSLLARDTEAGDLAGHLFEQPDARVLLLSATPYKAFTYAEEAAVGDDHYADLVRTLAFLGNGSDDLDGVRAGLSEFRRRALAGQPIGELRAALEQRLCRLMCRTERPALGADGMLTQPDPHADQITPDDLAGYVALHKIAESLVSCAGNWMNNRV